jgi:hypothetical protein
MSFILTHTHQIFNYADMRPENVSLLDLIEGAAYQYRFGGAGIIHRVTVLQHSLAASYVCPTRGMLAHDLHEVFCADIPSPMRPFVPDYCAFEDRIAACVRTALKLPVTMTDAEKTADKYMGLYELRHCLGWQNAPPIAPQVATTEEILKGIYAEQNPEVIKHLFWARWEAIR